MKRCLCIASTLDTGGAETFLMKIFRKIKQDHILDFIVSVEGKGFFQDEVEQMGGKVFYIPPRTQAPIKAYKDLKKIIKNNKYDYVLKLCDTPIGVTDVMAAKSAGVKRISVRSCNAAADVSVSKKIINAALQPFFNALIDVKIAPSDLAAEYTFGKKQVKKNKVNFLHNAVDMSVYSYNEKARDAVREELGIKDKIVIGHIGRFDRQKNHLFLLEVFNEIRKQDSNAILALVGGNGHIEAEVRQRVKDLNLEDSVIFTGVRSDIPEILSAMDAFVLPSFYEGMPNTVIEAQATGLNCIIADTITRQANITGLVEYLPLNLSPEIWAKKVLDAAKKERKNTKEDFIKNKYDIESTVEEFKRLVFGE